MNVRDLRTSLAEDSLLEAYAYLWQELLRHDEMIAATHLTRACPWRIRHRVEVQEIAEITRAATIALDNAESYRDLYGVQTGFTWPPGFTPQEATDGTALRYLWIMSALSAEAGPENRRLRILELGCADGFMTWRVAEKGHFVTAIDAIQGNIDLAKTYPVSADEIRQRVTFVRGDFPGVPLDGAPFDVVLATEVWEHVRDEIALMNYIFGVLCPGGAAIVTTPDGSYMRGMGEDRGSWYRARQHVRATPLWELVDRFRASFGIEEAASLPIPNPLVPGQKMAVLRARRP